MNLEEAIHARWAADATLNGLLPATDVHTGRYRVADPTFPFATIEITGGTARDESNEDALAYPTVQFKIYHAADSHDALKSIVNAMVDAFHQADFNLDGGDKVLDMKLDGEPVYSQDEPGNWIVTTNFTSMTLVAA